MHAISGISSGVGVGAQGRTLGEVATPQGMGRLSFKTFNFDRPMTEKEIRNTTFKDLVLGGVGEVNMMQQQADRAVEKLMVGGDIGMAEVLTAVQKADIAFKMMMQIRNKLVQAYQEIQNMRV